MKTQMQKVMYKNKDLTEQLTAVENEKIKVRAEFATAQADNQKLNEQIAELESARNEQALKLQESQKTSEQNQVNLQNELGEIRNKL